jgi:hypothetical protein
MALQVTFSTDSGEKVVRVDDLLLDVLEAIAKDDPEAERWGDISLDPFRNVNRAYAVLDALADLVGVDHVERSLSARALEDMLEIVPNVDEEPMQDGYPQVPGRTEDGSSSTSPGPLTTGPSTSPDDTPNENS